MHASAFILGFVLVAPATGLAQSADTLPISPASAADIAEAMTSKWACLFPYQGDGTAYGDTTVRMAGLGVADLEGGDRLRGLRLVAAALARGVSDSLFFSQAAVYAGLHRRRDLAIALSREGMRHWPDSPTPWTLLAESLRRVGELAAADSARARAEALMKTAPGR